MVDGSLAPSLAQSLAALPERFRAPIEWLGGWCTAYGGRLTCHVGGSLVTDRIDEWSDVDGHLTAPAEEGEAVFAALRSALHADWATRHEWVLPLPTWHGGRQLFVEVEVPARGGPVWVLLDVVVAERAAAGASVVVDPRRHGRPIVVFDPGSLIRVEEEPDAALAAAAREAAERVAVRLPIARSIVEKAIARGHWPEACASYLRFGVEPTVQLLRTRHAPARWDFGLRYLDQDLPSDARARVVGLLPGPPEALPALAAECFAWQEELLGEAGLSAPR